MSELAEIQVRRILAESAIRLKIGSFGVSLSSAIPGVAQHLVSLYKDFELLPSEGFVDLHVELNPPSLLRRMVRPQVLFSFDGYLPFAPLPICQAGAMFEWGLNWCIANIAHHFLIVHAAVIEKNGKAFVMPGVPGAGKSTLCAALVCNGWRLLSDEMALLSVRDGMLYPLSRPISLKNQSMDVLLDKFPDVYIGSIAKNTSKGSVGHMRPPIGSIEQSELPAKPAGIIFPQYKAGADAELRGLDRGEAFMKVIRNCVNYNVLGNAGFDLLADMVDRSDCYDFQYHDLNDAFRIFDQLSLG